jgi:hypothetical protein
MVSAPHAGKIVTVELDGTTLRIIDQHGELLTTVPHTRTGEISRFKACGKQGPCRLAQKQPHPVPRRRRPHDPALHRLRGLSAACIRPGPAQAART